MTAHKVRRKRLAKGASSGGQFTRIVVSLPPEDFRRLAFRAARREVPVATVLRDAVRAYLLTGNLVSCAKCGELFEAGVGTGRRADAKFCSDAHREAAKIARRAKRGVPDEAD